MADAKSARAELVLESLFQDRWQDTLVRLLSDH